VSDLHGLIAPCYGRSLVNLHLHGKATHHGTSPIKVIHCWKQPTSVVSLRGKQIQQHYAPCHPLLGMRLGHMIHEICVHGAGRKNMRLKVSALQFKSKCVRPTEVAGFMMLESPRHAQYLVRSCLILQKGYGGSGGPAVEAVQCTMASSAPAPPLRLHERRLAMETAGVSPLSNLCHV
jgi:hypothetical protein